MHLKLDLFQNRVVIFMTPRWCFHLLAPEVKVLESLFFVNGKYGKLSGREKEA